MTVSDILFVCPACRTSLTPAPDEYACDRCHRRYPVILGIPDFRLDADPWLSIEEDRAKGIRLEQSTTGQPLAETVAAYWRMTPATPANRAERFIEHVLGAERRSREWVEAEGLASAADSSTWIDLGCGTADLSSVLDPRRRVMAIDIAFRWLVVARRRLQARGLDNVTLVCASADALPLANGTAGRVLSLGLLEHVSDAERVLQEVRRVLVPRGHLHLRTTNRYSILPEPHVGMWGVGFLPRRTAERYVTWRTGQQRAPLRPPSAGELRRALSRTGFSGIVVGPATALPSDLDRLGRSRALASAYSLCRRWPLASRVLTWIAPVLEAQGVAS